MQVVVVGGGVAGLAAAHALATGAAQRDLRDVQVTVLEGSAQLGGLLRTALVAGLAVDVGAEAMLARRPEAVALAGTVGLADHLVSPVTSAARVLSRGVLRRLPARSVMGIPSDLGAVRASCVLDRSELTAMRWRARRPTDPLHGDVSVGAYVRRGFGPAVAERLVEPLLGGVYAGHADELSLRATVPALAAAAEREPSALAAAGRVRLAAPPSSAPVFAGLRGGVGTLAGAVAAAATVAGVQIETAAMARTLRRTPTGWRLQVGSAAAPRSIEADAVVLAVPAATAARLLRDAVPGAAAELGAVEAASVAVVTLAFAGTPRLVGSGFLIPPVEGRLMKAATFSSRKWGWYADADPGVTFVRASVGRHREEVVLHRDDDELVASVLVELRAITGITAAVVDSLVTRWGGALPQYAVGHLDRVARIRAAVSAQPGLAVCGATYDGVGIAAVVASAQAAAHSVLDQVAAWSAAGGQWEHG